MLRISTYVATGLSGLLPIVHAASIYPYAMLNQQACLGNYLVEGLALVISTVFYAVSRVAKKGRIWYAERIADNIDSFPRVLGA
jgi:predicted membrane channel-forming protein YqfA (hemolysin III family)